MPYVDADKAREWDRERKRRLRRERPEEQLAYKRAYYQRHKDSISEKRLLKESREREKGQARAALNRAVKKGLLVRGDCEMESEGCLGAIDAHHDDYTKPLEVRWLCKSHHMKLHLNFLTN